MNAIYFSVNFITIYNKQFFHIQKLFCVIDGPFLIYKSMSFLTFLADWHTLVDNIFKLIPVTCVALSK